MTAHNARELVGLLSLTLPVESTLTALGQCHSLLSQWNVTAVDVVRQRENGSGAAAVTLHVGLDAECDGELMPAAAGAAAPLLSRFGWSADTLVPRWSHQYRDYVETMASPGEIGAGRATGLAVMTRANLEHSLLDPLAGGATPRDATRTGRDRCWRLLDVPAQKTDIVVRLHAVVAAPSLAAVAARLPALIGQPQPAGLSLELHSQDPDLVDLALVCLAPEASWLDDAAIGVAGQYDLAGQPFVLHEISDWQVGAIEADPASVSSDGVSSDRLTVRGIYTRRGVDPCADFGLVSSFEPQELVLRSSITDEEAGHLMSLLRDLMVRVALVGDFVGVSEHEASTAISWLYRESLSNDTELEPVAELHVISLPDGLLRVTALSAAATDQSPETAVAAVRTALGREREWTILASYPLYEGKLPYVAHQWRPAARTQAWRLSPPDPSGEAGLVRLEVHAAHGLVLKAEE